METSHLLGLLVPAISGLFFVTFCILGYKRRALSYLLFVGLSFGLVGTGFGLKQFVLAPETLSTSLIVSACYVVAICLLTGAAAIRRAGKANLKLLVSLGLVTIMAIVTSTMAFENLSHRSIIHNTILAALFLIGTYPLTKLPNQDVLDRILLWAFLSVGITLSIISFTIFTAPTGLTTDNYYNSAYWFVLNVAVVTLMLAIAMALCGMAAIDVMREVQDFAESDFLSGLLIRSAFTREVAVISHTSDTICGIILFDLDHFKHINDAYGHSVGDNVIRAIGELVLRSVSEDAISGRLGGEEFAVVLPGFALTQTHLYAENLRQAIMRLNVDGLDANTRVTASFGITLQLPGQSFEQAYKEADLSLYQAKLNGRNRVNATQKDAA